MSSVFRYVSIASVTTPQLCVIKVPVVTLNVGLITNNVRKSNGNNSKS